MQVWKNGTEHSAATWKEVKALFKSNGWRHAYVIDSKGDEYNCYLLESGVFSKRKVTS